jgi:hypothetical protein
MPRSCRRLPMHPRLVGRRRVCIGEADATLAEAGAYKQAPGQAGEPDCVADEEGQAEPEGLQDLHLSWAYPDRAVKFPASS